MAGPVEVVTTLSFLAHLTEAIGGDAVAVSALCGPRGISLSCWRDLPSGLTSVVSFGGFLALAGIVHYLARAPQRARAAGRVLAGAAGLLVFVFALRLLRKPGEHDLRHLLEIGTVAERLAVLERLDEQPGRHEELAALLPGLLADAGPKVQRRLLELVEARELAELLPDVHDLLSSGDDELRESALRAVRHFHRPQSAAVLFAAIRSESDDYVLVELGEALLELGARRGAEVLLGVLAGDAPRGARRDAFEHLSAHVDLEHGYDAQADPADRRGQAEVLLDGWAAHPDIEIHHGQPPAARSGPRS